MTAKIVGYFAAIAALFMGSKAKEKDTCTGSMETRLSKVIDQCHEEWLADGTVKEKPPTRVSVSV